MTTRFQEDLSAVRSPATSTRDAIESLTAMTEQFHAPNQQLIEPWGERHGTELNDWQSKHAATGSSNRSPSNLAATNHEIAPHPHDPFRDYVNNECFNSLIRIVQDAPKKCISLCAKILPGMMEAKKLVALFERVRRHAVHRTLSRLDEVILFAVADMFTSESKVSSWYGPKLVTRMLAVENHHVRYLILSLVLAAFSADMKFNMSLKSTTQFLAGSLVVLKDALKFMNHVRNSTEEYRTCLDKCSQTTKPQLASIRTEWFLFHKNPYLALRIFRLIVSVDPIRDFINKHDGFQTIAISLLSNPIAPEVVFRECLNFAAKSHGFLGILDKRVPLGTVPQVVMHVAEYCMNRSSPSWSVPRFLTNENVSTETFNKTSEIVYAAVKSFAASIERESLYFEPLCDCIMRMYSTEVLTDKGNTIGRAFGTILSRFPSCISLKDGFIVELIAGIHSCKDEIANLVDDLLDVIVSQYPGFMKKHVEAIREARNIRKLLQYSLDGRLNYFPEMPHDWYP